MIATDVSIKKAARLINTADALLICAGAGIGVDSGLPDFRGENGFWKAYPAYAKTGKSFVDVANLMAFRNDPMAGWGFYGHRLNLYRSTVPHEGFQILRKWSDRTTYKSFVYTSNVDGQFQKAGFTDVCEVHGSIHHVQCQDPYCSFGVASAKKIEITVDTDTMMAVKVPLCPICDKVLRPNILMFGDCSWNHRLVERSDDLLRSWLQEVRQQGARLAIVEIGAGTAIPSVRIFSERIANSMRTHYVRINPRETYVDSRGIAIKSSGLKALKAIDKAIDRMI